MRAPRFLFLAVCLGLLALAPSAAASEPFFPHAGSHAYDATGYRVRLAYQPGKGGRIEAIATVTATARRELSEFSFDFFGPRVSRVRVDGRAARFGRSRGKLDVFPPEPIAAGESFVTEVRYAGRPPTIIDPDGSQEGWYPTDDGVLAVGEPQGTAAWIPCNDIPTDKASFGFEITVPRGLKAVANGRLEHAERRRGLVHTRWVEPAPMSPYLAVLDIAAPPTSCRQGKRRQKNPWKFCWRKAGRAEWCDASKSASIWKVPRTG